MYTICRGYEGYKVYWVDRASGLGLAVRIQGLAFTA